MPNLPSVKSKSAKLASRLPFKKGVLPIAVLIAAAGIIFITVTRAAGPNTSLEAEGNTPTGSATVQTDGTASGGKYVQFGGTTTTPSPSPSAPVGALKTCYPHAFCDSNNNPVAINGININPIGHYSVDVTCNLSGSHTQFMQRGFNTVRLAVDWSLLHSGPTTFASAGLAKLDEAVNQATAAGQYIILDPIHLESAGSKTPSWTTGADSVDKVNMGAAWYLVEIAKRYKSNQKVIAIDLVNEPWQPSINQNRVLTMYNNLINAVRAVDPTRILIIEPTYGGTGWQGADWNIITNKSNLVVSEHHYFAGGDDDGYATNGLNTAGNAVYNGTSGYPSPNAAQINAHFDRLVNWMAGPRLPLFVGEWGLGRDVANHDQWIKDSVAAMKARNNLARTWWNGCNDGSMALHAKTANQWMPWINLLTN